MASHAPDGELHAASLVLRPHLLRILLATLLAGLTLLLYLGIGRFTVDGPELLPPMVLHGPAAGWSARGAIAPDGATGAVLRNDDPAGSSTLSHTGPVPDDARYLRLSADLRMEDVVGGRRLWESGRLILVSRDGPSADWHFDLPHTVLRATGSMGWRHLERAFLVPPGGEARVAVQLLHATGQLWVRNMSLQRAVEHGWFPAASALLVGFWCAGGVWILWPLAAPLLAALRARRLAWQHLRRAALLLVLLAITGAVLVPPSGKQMVRDLAGDAWVLARGLVAAGPPAPSDQCRPASRGVALAPLAPLDPRAAQAGGPATQAEGDLVAPNQLRWLVVDKLGHFCGFALLAVLACWAMPRPADWRAVALLALALPGFAAITETWQLMLTTRGASLTDIAIDTAGIVLGAVVWLLLLAARRLLRRRRGGGAPGGAGAAASGEPALVRAPEEEAGGPPGRPPSVPGAG